MDNRKQLKGHDSHESRELMLQSRQGQMLNAHHYPETGPVPIQSTDDFAFLIEFARILWKRRWVVVLMVLVGAVTAMAVTFWMTPMYSARTTMAIENAQEPFGGKSVTDPLIMTQVQLLTSETLRERALSKLKGRTNVEPPEVFGPLATLRNMLGLEEPATSVDWNKALYMAAGSTKVTNTRESNVLEVVSQSANPQAAADFTNTLAAEYIQHIQEQRWD